MNISYTKPEETVKGCDMSHTVYGLLLIFGTFAFLMFDYRYGKRFISWWDRRRRLRAMRRRLR